MYSNIKLNISKYGVLSLKNLYLNVSKIFENKVAFIILYYL